MLTKNIVMDANLDYPLNAVITFPEEGSWPYPAAVLVQGTGILDIDGTIGSNKPMKDIAEGLAKRGIASIRSYKRSYMYMNMMLSSSGTTVWGEIIYDALTATSIIKARPEIDENRVFVIGHELGGMMAPRINAEGGAFAGLIMMAGSPRRLEEIFQDQHVATVHSLHGPLRLIAARQAKKMERNMLAIKAFNDEDAKSIDVIKHFTAYYFKEMGKYPTPELLRKTKVPMLFLQGESDFQILMEKDFEAYKNIMRHQSNATFYSYPGLNHYFMPAYYSDIRYFKKEYKQVRKVSDAVLDDIATWIFSQENCLLLDVQETLPSGKRRLNARSPKLISATKQM